MPTNDLRELVAAEIQLLRANATPDELMRLNIHRLEAISRNNCVYGQMTGYHDNPRARDLKQVCGVYARDFRLISGSALQPSFNNPDPRAYIRRFTVLEHYITIAGAKNLMVIAYLRGELETITPAHL